MSHLANETLAPHSAVERSAPASPPAPATIREPSAASWYRREPWLLVGLIALLPVTLAAVLPTAWKAPMIVAGGVLFVLAAVLMHRRDRAARATEAAELPERRRTTA